MDIAIWGLGYVGTVSAACFAQLGHNVIGVETNPAKVEALNKGTSTVVEPGLSELVSETTQTGKLCATQNGVEYVAKTQLSLICVGTPSYVDGSADLSYLINVLREIGQGLRQSSSYHVVVVRSTVQPGVMEDIVIPELEATSGCKAGQDFGVVFNPEFLRETTAIKDFFNPPYTVIGELDSRSGDLVAELYKSVDAPVHRVKFDEAALLKVVNNGFHALKIGFANEIGRVCDALGLNSHTVMGLVCEDTKLNISPAYLRPGYAFGGSCLPKDLRSLIFKARQSNVSVPIIDAILPSNRIQIDEARLKIHRINAGRIGILGLSFKSGTDDLRESPVLDLIRDLWRDGLDLTVYDPDIHLDKMLGSNRAYLDRELPQIERIFKTDISEALKDREVVVVTHKRPEFTEALLQLPDSVTIIDVIHLGDEVIQQTSAKYVGLSW